MSPVVITTLSITVTALVSGIYFWIMSKRSKNTVVQVAVIDERAYWRFNNEWFTAPVIHTNDGSLIDNEHAKPIDIDNAPMEQVELLMEILERFES